MNAAQVVMKLTVLGYHFEVAGEKLRWRYQGPGYPDPEQVRPLLALVKEHKPEVLAYLTRPIPPERVLTCYDCHHFQPAVNSPNPAHAWGHCKKRNKGRFGVATACKAILTPPDARER